MKHLKIMSNDKVVFEVEIKDCYECPLHEDPYSFCLLKRMLEQSQYDKKCPLEDKA